jgi:hypothetical protein
MVCNMDISKKAEKTSYVGLDGLGILDLARGDHVPIIVEGAALHGLQVDLHLVLRVGKKKEALVPITEPGLMHVRSCPPAKVWI